MSKPDGDAAVMGLERMKIKIPIQETLLPLSPV